MPKQPHNEHELELALTRLAGSNLGAVKYRDMMSGVILGQMLPSGTVVKGGSSLRLRFGPENSRVTMDFDTARSLELDEYVKLAMRKAELTDLMNMSSSFESDLQRDGLILPERF